MVRRNEYLKFRRRAIEGSVDVDRLKSDVANALDQSAQQESLGRFREAIQNTGDLESFIDTLDAAYAVENRIIVSDQGTGMSQQDLIDNYLVIGTASRRRAIDVALTENTAGKGRPPYLGEKGIGRLSAMRLGDRLTVVTAEKEDKRLNQLKIDWSAFNNLDAMLNEINIIPNYGGQKPELDWSGTQLIIENLSADWTYKRVKDLGEQDFAQLTNPFADAKWRSRLSTWPNLLDFPKTYLHMKRRQCPATVRDELPGIRSSEAFQKREIQVTS